MRAGRESNNDQNTGGGLGGGRDAQGPDEAAFTSRETIPGLEAAESQLSPIEAVPARAMEESVMSERRASTRGCNAGTHVHSSI